MLTRILLLLALAIASPASAQMTTVFADSPGAGCNGGMAPPPGWNCSQLVLDDQFPGTTLNTSNWVAGLYSINAGGRWTNAGALASPLSGINSVANGGNVTTYFDPAQVTVSGGVATLTMTNSSSQTGYQQVSGAICTYPNYYPTTGSGASRVLIQVKEQQSDATQGGWGGPWGLRGQTTGTEQETDLQESGFLAAGTPYNNMMASDVHVGSTDLGQNVTNVGADLSAGYHIIGMDYQLGSRVDYYFDQGASPVKSYTSSILNVPMTFQITLNQAATNTSSYHTCTDSNGSPASPRCSNTTGTITLPISLKIKEVQIYQR